MSTIADQQLAIANQQLAIANQQLAIANQKITTELHGKIDALEKELDHLKLGLPSLGEQVALVEANKKIKQLEESKEEIARRMATKATLWLEKKFETAKKEREEEFGRERAALENRATAAEEEVGRLTLALKATAADRDNVQASLDRVLKDLETANESVQTLTAQLNSQVTQSESDLDTSRGLPLRPAN